MSTINTAEFTVMHRLVSVALVDVVVDAVRFCHQIKDERQQQQQRHELNMSI